MYYIVYSVQYIICSVCYGYSVQAMCTFHTVYLRCLTVFGWLQCVVWLRGQRGGPSQGRFPGVGISERPLHTKVRRRRRLWMMMVENIGTTCEYQACKSRVAFSDTKSENLKSDIFNETTTPLSGETMKPKGIEKLGLKNAISDGSSTVVL